MKACRGARVEREWHRFGPDAQGLELAEALRIRAKALADREPVMVDPEEIPTFGRRRRSQRAEDRDTPLRQAVGNRGLLSAAQLLPHPEHDGPAIRHEDRIVDEDRVGASLLRLLVVPD